MPLMSGGVLAEPYINQDAGIGLYHGDSKVVLMGLPSNSFDSMVTDPPAGISFMGKGWDGDKGGRDEWIKWLAGIMREAHRVLKPGAHGLVWALPRTSHWTAMALENAGFEVRDVVTHLFGTGFPKSARVNRDLRFCQCALSEHSDESKSLLDVCQDCGKPVSNGTGTALKPASEHWILVQKPISKETVAANVLEHGTGGLNIDACRIGTEERFNGPAAGDAPAGGGYCGGFKNEDYKGKTVAGRFPANLVLSHSDDCTNIGTKKIKGSNFGGSPTGRKQAVFSKDDRPRPAAGFADADGSETVEHWECSEDCAVKALDEQSGTLKNGGQNATSKRSHQTAYVGGRAINDNSKPTAFAGDSGGASRFFYVAKTSKSERGKNNHHPTVKPKKLMAYLIKLVTPPSGIVLDPFMGSGSTGVAAIEEKFSFVGIEKNRLHLDAARERIEGAI